MTLTTAIVMGVTLAATPPIAMLAEHYFGKRRRARIVAHLAVQGERTTYQLREVFGHTVYVDLHVLEDDGVLERRLRKFCGLPGCEIGPDHEHGHSVYTASGDVRGVREVAVYRLVQWTARDRMAEAARRAAPTPTSRAVSASRAASEQDWEE
jgi:hypothetical protein